MPGLVPGIHVFLETASKTWTAGTSPAMTWRGLCIVLATLDCGGATKAIDCMSSAPLMESSCDIQMHGAGGCHRPAGRHGGALYPLGFRARCGHRLAPARLALFCRAAD